jgi:hypothetical protein
VPEPPPGARALCTCYRLNYLEANWFPCAGKKAKWFSRAKTKKKRLDFMMSVRPTIVATRLPTIAVRREQIS